MHWELAYHAMRNMVFWQVITLAAFFTHVHVSTWHGHHAPFSVHAEYALSAFRNVCIVVTTICTIIIIIIITLIPTTITPIPFLE